MVGLEAAGATLAQGGVVLLWCGAGQTRAQAARSARLAGAQALDGLGMPAGLELNRSAAQGGAVVALRLAGRVGVDVESATAQTLGADEIGAWLHPAEQALLTPGREVEQSLQAWVRKEAVLKALGLGLAYPPQRCRVGLASPAWQPVDLGDWGRAQVRTVSAPWPGFHAALALPLSGPAAQPCPVWSVPVPWGPRAL